MYQPKLKLSFAHFITKLKLGIVAKRRHMHHSYTSCLGVVRFDFGFEEIAASHDHSKQYRCYLLTEKSFDTKTVEIATSYHSSRNLTMSQKPFVSYFATEETAVVIECEAKLRSTPKQHH